MPLEKRERGRQTEKTNDSLISILTYPSVFIVNITVHVRTIIECPISPSNWSSASLVHEMPVKTGIGAVLRAFVLQK